MLEEKQKMLEQEEKRQAVNDLFRAAKVLGPQGVQDALKELEFNLYLDTFRDII